MNHLLMFLLQLFAGWVKRRQLDVIAPLREENTVLREHIVNRRLRFTNAQQRRLALKGKAVGRKALPELDGIITPDTILR